MLSRLARFTSPWFIAGLCVVLLVSYVTVTTIYLIRHIPQVVVVKIEVPGFTGPVK